MKTPDALPRMYEDLANHHARQGESRQRDNCLVLAADAALAAGIPEEAERLRKGLLLTNPHHLLRPYASMAEAMQSDDVRDYVADLRRQIPPEMAAKLVHQAAPEKTYALAEPVATKPSVQPKASGPKAPAASARTSLGPPDNEFTSPTSYWLSLMLLAMGLALAGGLVFVTVVWPLLE
jgi:CO/xanthine dehydrogenase Mo-binding subunit